MLSYYKMNDANADATYRTTDLIDGPHDAVDAFTEGAEKATAASTTTRKIRLGLSRLLQADNATTRFVEELREQ